MTRTLFGRALTGRVIGAVVAVAVVLVLIVVGGIFLLGGRNSHTTSTSTPSSVSSTSTSPTPSGSSTVDPTQLSQQFRLGAWAGGTDQTATGRVNAFTSLQNTINVDLSIVHVYKGSMDTAINGPVETQAVAQGKTLLISWAGGDTRDTAAGKFDSIIAARAHEVAALKVPVFFQFRWEMDRSNLNDVVHSPADYIAAWKHVRTIFAAQKVTNAEFVWCPQASAFADGTAQKYYPGDASVDWICADLYPPPNAAPVSFAQLAAPFLTWADPHKKPIMFGEFGVPKSYGANRAAWLSAIKPVVQQNPLIRALVYFNAVGTHQNYSLNDDVQALNALAALGTGLGAKPR